MKEGRVSRKERRKEHIREGRGKGGTKEGG
jgi:hypothetical protein